MKLDILAVAAHPDDAEICIGGLLLAAVARGKQVGIVDLTRGELGTRGSAQDRARETAAADALLRPALRRNLELPDGRVEVSLTARERLAEVLRECRPDVLLAHHVEDLHPDHAAAGQLAREAWYLAGLARLAPAGQEARRPARLYHFMGHVPFEPTLLREPARARGRRRPRPALPLRGRHPAARRDTRALLRRAHRRTLWRAAARARTAAVLRPAAPVLDCAPPCGASR